MPTGKKLDRVNNKWVNVDKTRALNYENHDQRAAELLITYWKLYPDRYLKLCEAEKPNYVLAPIQELMLRADCRYQEEFTTGGRGISKSYVGFISRLIMGDLFPGIRMYYWGPFLKQTVKIVSDIYKEVCVNYPILAAEWSVVHDSEDLFSVKTEYGSVIEVGVMRGLTGNSVFVEECAQSEAGEAFDHEKYAKVVTQAIRGTRLINGERDDFYPNYQKVYATTAGSKQNESFKYRTDILADCRAGKRAIVLDIPAEIAVLNGIRPFEWYQDQKRKSTPETWLNEMGAIWTGVSENPIIRDSILTESRTLALMEHRHCQNPDVMYVIGYDVSYTDGGNNAKCATSIVKCSRQDEPFKQNQYMKSLVYVLDNPPPPNAMLQARQLKERWKRFTMDNSNYATYIAIDTVQYGMSVLEALHQDLDDGLPPLCCIDHDFPELERPGALPVIYPIRAVAGIGSTGTSNDSDCEMIRYCQMEFEHRNVELLIPSVRDGVIAFRNFHHIKEESHDTELARPYIETKRLCAQIANLKAKPAAYGFKEERVSKAIQRDKWSAFKYAMRLISILERKNLMQAARESSWKKEFENPTNSTSNPLQAFIVTPRTVGRIGGNIR